MPTDGITPSQIKNSILSLKDSKGPNTAEKAAPVKTESAENKTENAPSGDTSPQNLSTRANDLALLLDNINTSAKTIEATNQAIEELKTAFESLRLAAEQAYDFLKEVDDNPLIRNLETIFNNTLSTIDTIVAKAETGNTNLLRGDDLETGLNETRSNTLVTQGAAFNLDNLGIDPAAFADQKAAAKSVDQVKDAISDLRDFQIEITSNLSTITTQRDFTAQTISTLNAGAEELGSGDQSDEAVNLLALQTRLALSQSGFSLASPDAQSVLRLF